MNEIVLSTAYLPNTEYFGKLLSSPSVRIEQHENYIKQTYRNRCDILTANGVTPLVIPVKRLHGAKMPVREVCIDYDTNWQTIHWRAINAAYRSSPFFEYYIDDLLPFYRQREKFLFDFNMKLLTAMMEICGINTEVKLTPHYEQKYDEDLDFRYSISPKSKNISQYKPTPYYQVFNDRMSFQPNLSILDLVCNEGNNSWTVLSNGISAV